MDKALEELRRQCVQVGGRNKLAKLLAVTEPYVGRVLLSARRETTTPLMETFVSEQTERARPCRLMLGAQQ
jgi:DNA-binding transcriptional regulator YdaS (Cro superfamily)